MHDVDIFCGQQADSIRHIGHLPCAKFEMVICRFAAFHRSRAGTGPFRVTFEVEIRELGEDSQQVFAGIQVVGLAGFHEGRQMLFCNWNIMRLCHFTNVLYG